MGISAGVVLPDDASSLPDSPSLQKTECHI